MNILLTGVGYNNKGAELMLCAMVQHLRLVFPDSRIACDYAGTFGESSRYGLYQFATRNRGRIVRLIEWLPEKTRQEWGILLPKEIDVVLDASGFAFGDQWSVAHARREGDRCLKYKANNGSKLVLMPQAFGPFENEGIRSYCIELFSAADLIFPRDQQSFQFVQGILPSSEVSAKLHLAPDFTNLVQGIVPSTFDSRLFQSVGILPNEKIIAKKGEEEAKKYIAFLVHCIRSLKSKNIPHFILCHQNEDQKVVELLRTQLVDSMPYVVSESNPVFIKGILGTCRFLIGSRFHGLINGLSQGVPGICTSWSHKYEALYEDYRCSDFLISDLSALDKVDHLISRLLDENSYRPIHENVEINSARIKVDAEKMWNVVDTFLRQV